MSTITITILNVFRVCLKGENDVLLSSPVFNLKILFDHFHSQISQLINIYQSVIPSFGNVRIQVTHTYYPLNSVKGYSLCLVLIVQFLLPFLPSAFGRIIKQFKASFILNEKWDGKGNFYWGKMAVLDLPVTLESCKKRI